MTGDPTRDDHATPHDFAAPDVPWDDNDYRAHARAEADKAAARQQREAEQRARQDAAHEKAKAEKLRAEFLRLLTEDGPTNDRRRKEYNQAIFMPEGHAVWSETTLDMVMDKFDRAAKAATP